MCCVIGVQTAAALRGNTISAASNLKRLRSPVKLWGTMNFCIQFKNWATCPRLICCSTLDKVCYKALPSPPIKSQRKPSLLFFMISDLTVRLWYHCCHNMDLYPSRMESGRVGGLLLKKTLRIRAGIWDISATADQWICFFKQTLTNLLKIPTEPSSQPRSNSSQHAIHFIQSRQLSTSQQHQS